MDLKTILKSAAPMLSAAIGGPFGAMAAKLAAEALGDPSSKPEDLPTLMASATPEQIAALKKAEMDFKVRMTELGYANEEKLAALVVEDRKSAREMQTSTRSRIPGVLAVLVVLAWGLVQWFLLTHVVDQSMRELVARVLGTLDGALMVVLSFYFGSSHGSQQKTELMASKG